MPGPARGAMRDILKLHFVTRIRVSFLWAADLVYDIAGESARRHGNTKRL